MNKLTLYFYLIFLTLGTNDILAQNSTFRSRVDSVFDQLNQTYIPSGILLDRTIQLYDMI